MNRRYNNLIKKDKNLIFKIDFKMFNFLFQEKKKN